VDIYDEELLVTIASNSATIGSLHPVHEATRLELLQCIVPDQIDQVDTHYDEQDEYVVKTRIHNCAGVYSYLYL
jgi:hypothetical protein